MALTHRMIISVFLILLVGACENAKLSLANTPKNPPVDDSKKDDDKNDPQKPDCSGTVSTIGVYDSKENLIASMTPWLGELTPEDNYNYHHEAADVQIGPQVQPKFASHFFYNYQSDLYLNLVLDRFHEFRGDAIVNLKIDTLGNELADRVILSDEHREMRVVETNKTLETRTYRGTFEYQEFGDGAIIGPFKGNNWEMAITYEAATEIEHLLFADSKVKGLSFSIEEKSLQTLVVRPVTLGVCELPRPQ